MVQHIGQQQRTERLIRDLHRLKFCWYERKQMCKNYAIIHDVLEDKIDRLQDQVTRLEIALARHQRDHCEAE